MNTSPFSVVPSNERARSPRLGLVITAHACLRYAQRVLGMHIDHDDLQKDAALRGRCERGIARLLERADCGKTEDGEIWVTRTRALVVENAHVVTLLVAPTSKGFRKRFFRRHGSPARAA